MDVAKEEQIPSSHTCQALTRQLWERKSSLLGESSWKVKAKPKEHFKTESDFKEPCWGTCTWSFSYFLAMFDYLQFSYSFSQISTTNPLMDLRLKIIQPANIERKSIIFHEEIFDLSSNTALFSGVYIHSTFCFPSSGLFKLNNSLSLYWPGTAGECVWASHWNPGWGDWLWNPPTAGAPCTSHRKTLLLMSMKL